MADFLTGIQAKNNYVMMKYVEAKMFSLVEDLLNALVMVCRWPLGKAIVNVADTQAFINISND